MTSEQNPNTQLYDALWNSILEPDNEDLRQIALQTIENYTTSAITDHNKLLEELRADGISPELIDNAQAGLSQKGTNLIETLTKFVKR